MKCHCCEKTSIIENPHRCKEHFLEEFEERVKKTIQDYQMIDENEKILIAASGGKDSLTVLNLLSQWYKDVTAVVIDEGIQGYREHTLVDLKKVCERLNIPLMIKSYEDFAGATLDKILDKNDFHPCGVCGAFRRHLIHQASKKFDVLVTGHNADDEAQAVVMNLLKGNTDILPRSGPVSGHGAKGFVKRVKPLYYCSEKEVMTYAFLNGLTSHFTECPNVKGSFRDLIRDSLNIHFGLHPGDRKHILDSFLKLKSSFGPVDKVNLNPCTECGEPSAAGTCKACQYLLKIKNIA